MANGLGELEMELELEGFGESEGELEGEFELEGEGEFETEFESELELEGEGEGEFELEGEAGAEHLLNPAARVYPDAMMEHLGLAAMEAETEFEAAEQFLPLIPMVASKLLPLAAKALPRIAGKVLPRIARVISRATPRLTRHVGHITRVLHRDPRKRHLVRVIPSVARRAVTTIARHAAAGRPVSPRHAARILAHEHRRVLHNPHILRSVLRRSRVMDRHLHRIGRHHLHPGIHPHGIAGAHLRGRHLHPHHPHHAHWGVGHRRRFCPTCGTPTHHVGRRCCCCC